MWSSLSLAWQLAFDQGWKAYCSGSIPIGSVITNEDGDIISMGRNRTRENTSDGEKAIFGTPLAHAEINAILGLDFDKADPYTSVIYSTLEPCPLCVGAIGISRIRTIRYAAEDSYGGSTELLESNSYLREKKIKVEGPFDRTFEMIINALQMEYFLHDDRPGLKEVFEAWKKTGPLAVQVGKVLFEKGDISKLRRVKASSEDVLGLVYSRILEVRANSS